MNIRRAQPLDIPDILALMKLRHGQTPVAAIPISERDVCALLLQLMQSAKGCVAVGEVDGAFTGAVVGGIDRAWWSRKAIAQEIFLAAADGVSALPLAQYFREWAAKRPGVAAACLSTDHSLTVPEAMEGGFAVVGTMVAHVFKEVPHGTV